jgi:uncharacterized protein YhfF
MKNGNPATEDFWRAYLASLPPDAIRPATYQAWHFGNNADMADRLGHLVKTGVKTATCSLVWVYEAEQERLPQVGDLSIITTWDGEPLCVIETTQTEVKAFDQVDEQFAYDEGEGDRSLAYWRRVHEEFFAEECAAIGRQPSHAMPLLCERFRLVFTGQGD